MLGKEMYFKKEFFLIIIFLLLINDVSASTKKNIINKFKEIKNISFEFEQNINGKIENGSCTIEYPKKIYCKYDLNNKKILVSNGKLLVIKTLSSYYLYPLEKTPLETILDKKFIIEKIENLKERNINNNLVNYKFLEKDNEINLFFDKQTFNLIGWQTVDIFQNISITYLSAIKKNQKLNKNLFILPKQN